MDFFQKIKSFLHSEDDPYRNIWTEKELSDFGNNLRQVISWTDVLSQNFDFTDGDYGLVFRQTNPELNNRKLYTFDGYYTTWAIDDYSFESYDLLLSLALKRRPNTQQFDLTQIENSGRILSFQTCITTHDGAPIIESECFVDESDALPIDTWFYVKRDYFHSERKCDQTLFCWIPTKFENVMQQAMNV